jgi:hypothetical protein
LEGEADKIEVTNRGKIIGVYSRPKKSEQIPFFGVSTKNLIFDRDELNARG